MASLSSDKGRNGHRVSFYDINKRKRSFWLSGLTKRQAETVKCHVEALLTAKLSGTSIDSHTARWLGAISDTLRKKLVTCDLLDETAGDRGPTTLQTFLEHYINQRADVKESTRTQYRCVMKSLVDFFGAKIRLDAISAADAERWRIHLRTQGNRRDEDLDGWADNTVRRTTGRARQFFQHAVNLKLITDNPFNGFAVAVHGNTKRQRFITQKTILKALESCCCLQLRAVIALSRFGGIRVPSEIVRLTWADIDFEAGRLTVRASKTEHHADGGLRFTPIFPELRPFLQELHDQAKPGLDCPMTSPVISRWRSGNQNLRTEFQRVLTRAGISAWPKLFHNLRASRQTELLAKFPAKDVCDWLGNTQAVAMRHYAMATSESFERAVAGDSDTSCGSAGGSIGARQGPSEEISVGEKSSKPEDLKPPEALRHEQELPGQDLNLERLDQNQLCYQLHHRVTLNCGRSRQAAGV
jgi:integrase